ncbi:MAG: cytochrome C oxidase subunit IV family protein [Acidimicrobiia bacterium]|nr:cytochrome C oxidase subunit IV family protein [Acidimicrobiia bacterium]
MTTAEHASHPTPRQYWMVGGILAVITAIEVAVAYIEGLGGWVAPILIGLAAMKFTIVARWFMHLKFDKPLYSRFLVMGLIGALAMFTVVLFTFGILVGN